MFNRFFFFFENKNIQNSLLLYLKMISPLNYSRKLTTNSFQQNVPMPRCTLFKITQKKTISVSFFFRFGNKTVGSLTKIQIKRHKIRVVVFNSKKIKKKK